MHAEHTLLTLDDWRGAYRSGGRASTLIAARARRVAAESPAAVWISRASVGALQARAAQLDALLDACADEAQREALLARMPLFGVPFAVKDNIDVEGLPTTAACPSRAVMPVECATVVRRLVDAGAVLIGKTNLDQFATGLVGTRSPHGGPASVFDDERISGGSSSGSAVSVARADVVFSLGTDTAGSGRVPAGFNNIVGLKPSLGRVSTAGVLPACRTLDCVSIFALTVPDAAAVLAVIEGPDARDDYSDHAAGPATLGAGRPGKLRVGVPQTARVNAADGYDAAWAVACDRIQALGATAVPLDFSVLHEVAQLLYEGPWVAERYAVMESILSAQPRVVDPTVAAVVRKAEGQRAVDAFRAQYRLQHLRAQAQALWSQVDVLMVPTAPRHPRFSEVAADPIGVNSELGTYTNFVNLLGWSALAVPDGYTGGGLPFGVTFIGPRAADAALARWGALWHAATGLTMGRSDRAAPAAALSSEGLSRSSAAVWPQVEPTLPIAVVGAHLSGLPLNGQLLERRCTLAGRTRTAACYRLHALPGTTPPKPGLHRVPRGGVAIEVEVWNMPLCELGSFLALIPAPLGLGSIELEDGQTVHGFLCEAHALADAPDVSEHGGWRAYLQAGRSLQPA